MKRKISLLVLVAILSIVGLLTGCGDKPENVVSNNDAKSNESLSGGTLIIGVESEVDVLDPHRAGGWSTYRVNRQIYESLVDEDLSKPSDEVPVPPLKPALAEDWNISDDGLTYTFYLRKDVKFHDGTDFNADAVEFNVRRAWDESFEYYDAQSAGQLFHTYRFLKDVNVLGEYTIELVMERPFSTFLRMLTQGGMGSTGILSPIALKEHGQDAIGQYPVGTGPFKFKDRVLGQKVELERNEEYWGEKAYLDRVIFRPIPDATARVTALETGEVDVIAVTPPDSVENLISKGFKVETGTPPHVWYLQFNMNNSIMKDKAVRQAVSMAIDREGMAKNLLRGTVNPAFSIQSPGNEAFDPDFRDYEYNPKKAKKLLEEAGYPDGFDITYRLPLDGSGQLMPLQMAEWIQRDLANIGIKVKLDTQEWNTFLTVFAEGIKSEEIGFISTSWGFTTPYWLYIAAYSESGANVGHYKNEEIDQLLEKALSETDHAQSIQYWKDINVLLSENPAYVPIVNDKAPYAMAKNVEGFIVPAQEWYDLVQVRVK